MNNLEIIKNNFLQNQETNIATISKITPSIEKATLKIFSMIKYSGKLISSPSGATNRFQFNHMLKFYLGLKKNIQKKIKFKSPPYTRLRYNSSSKLINLLGNKKLLTF